jgi:ATP/maltotriose-dependent transcriptional regulator MalT
VPAMRSSDVSVPAVIETKLRVPSPRSEQVFRPGLLGMLEGGIGCRVTLVSAPAGYGKTILLSQWLRSREVDGLFAWVSLDEQDDDPIRLWRHIVESLGRERGSGPPFSHRQIGQSLYVYINTVKTHVRSIYRKLGVSSRDDALQRAREIALIQS